MRAFQRLGWEQDRMHGSHAILTKPGHECTLSIPCHNRDVARGLLGKQLKRAGISEDEYRRTFR